MNAKTTKNTGSGQQPAGFGVRLVAYLVDVMILVVAGAFWRTMFGMRLYNLVSFVMGASYSILLWVNWGGQTVGKRLLKLKVVGEDGKPVDYQAAILRYLGYIVSFVPLLLGFFWVIWDKDKQGWHDKIAKTKVVKI